MDKPAIKNIIFDLGGVILDIDYNKTKQAFIDLGVSNFDDYYQQSFSNPLFTQLEKGLITPVAFYDGLRDATGVNLTDPEIYNAWNAMLGSFRQQSIDLLNQLKNRYRIFLLSNTNAIHHRAFGKIYAGQFGNGDFDSHFEKAYYSHTMHERKPEAASYKYVLHEQNLVAEETLFIDDTYKNIDGAQVVGLQTLFIEHHKPVEVALGEIILL